MSTENKVIFTKQASAWFRGLAIFMVVLSHFADWWAMFHTLEGNAELIRLGISKFGPYGVAVFFLFSGYGLTKSAGEKRIDWRFLLKRITGVYIPYLVIVLLIDILSGSIPTVQDIPSLLLGQDFWYMTVLFLFYLAFMAIWLLFTNRHIRAVGMILFTIAMSFRLYGMERQDFWYLSNPAFALGVVIALYEPVLQKIPGKVNGILAVVFGCLSVGVVYSGLFVKHVWEVPEAKIRCEMWAVFIFTLFIIFLAASWKWYDVVLQFIGKYSLYMYLSHTFIFMWVINHVECSMPLRFLLAGAAILGISILLGVILTWAMGKVNQLLLGLCDRKSVPTK